MAGRTNPTALPFNELYGLRGGAPAVYLHGVPGAPVELELIDDCAREEGVELRAIDRARVDPVARGDRYLAALAEAVRATGGGKPLPVIGFSIGAALALRIAHRLGAEAGPLFLVSAAGPLDAPGALEGMGSGSRVFQLARSNGLRFLMLRKLQAFVALTAPRLLTRLLFAGADESDRSFAESPEGRRYLMRNQTRSWADGGASYHRDLQVYVGRWAEELETVTARVEMWHGRADTWAPLSMGRSIASALPAAPTLHIIPAGHYTTLEMSARAVFRRICALSPSVR